jgi:arylsulfatase A-like enzyme
MPLSSLRRAFSWFHRSTLILFTGLAATGVSAAPTSGAKPNILLILTDDLGYGDVGAFFADGIRPSGPRGATMTPALDRLAAQGARLTHHYCAAPVCAPSRASLLSGLHQGHANVRNNQFDKALADNHTLGTVLKRAGYATAAFGKWGLQGRVEGQAPNWPAHPLNRGFDFYFGYIRHGDGHEHYPKEAPYRNRDNSRKKKKAAPATSEESDDANAALFGKEVWENRREISATLDKCYTTDLFTARAKQWISDHAAKRPTEPFFTYLAFDTPHAVLELPTMAYPSGGGMNGGLRWLGTPGKMINTAGGTIDSWTHPDFAEATYDDDRNPGTPEKPWPDVYRRYATSVRRIDDAVADLVQLLRDLKLAENTLIVFSSDNGPSLESYLREQFSPEFFAGFGPFDGVKRDLWEGGARVPTIAWWPRGIPAGRTVATPSAHWDWLPTFAEVAGLPAPANADGQSLVADLSGSHGGRRSAPLYFEYRQDGRTPDFPAFEPARRNRVRREMQSLRTGDIVAVRYDVQSAEDDFEIYDVVRDPKQTRNLAADPVHAARQRELKARVLQVRRPDATAPRPYDEALVPAAPPAAASRAGLAWQRVGAATPWVPARGFAAASAQGSMPTLDLTVVARGQTGAFAASIEGFLQVPTDGDYTFFLSTDTGAVLHVHDALLIDADYGYRGGSVREARIRLQAGLHPLRLATRHAGTAAPTLTLEWSGPGVSRAAIPAAAWRH